MNGSRENSLLLPILIPLFTHPFFKTQIENSNIRSSMHTVFFKHFKELYDLQDRINSLKILTSDSIQYCLVNEWLETDINSLSFIPIQKRIVKKELELLKILLNYLVIVLFMKFIYR
ncbi:three component ABC system middle component [Neisseria flavescens]|uniref:three component ABC system middle component n=1 Tax=Neisseria flavescens TaxID=484 RepID=UPI003D80AD56